MQRLKNTKILNVQEALMLRINWSVKQQLKETTIQKNFYIHYDSEKQDMTTNIIIFA